MPRGVSGLCVVGGLFSCCNLAPSADAVGHNFNQKNSPVLYGAKTRFKRRLQLHVYFTKYNGLNLHKAPRRNSVSDCSSNANLTLRHYGTAVLDSSFAVRRQKAYAGAPRSTIPIPIPARAGCIAMVLATRAMAA